METLGKYVVEIILGLISAGALAFCKYLSSQLKSYKKLLDEKEAKIMENVIETQLEPIYQELEDLRIYVRKAETLERTHINLIVASYKFRLTQLCRGFLRQEYMTQDQYEQLVEFYKVYEGLGGNGQAKEIYDKTIKLPIHD